MPEPVRQQSSRVDLGGDLTSLIEVPKDPKVLRAHVEDLAVQRQFLDRSEVKSILARADKAPELFEGLYRVFAAGIRPDQQLYALLKSAPLVDLMTLGTVLSIWSAASSTKILEDCCQLFAERPDAFRKAPTTLGQEVLRAVEGARRFGIKSRLTPAAIGRIDVALRLSQFPKQDLALLVEHPALASVKTKEVEDFYRGGSRYLPHPFCFMKQALIVETAETDPALLAGVKKLSAAGAEHDNDPLEFLAELPTGFTAQEYDTLRLLEHVARHPESTPTSLQTLLGRFSNLPTDVRQALLPVAEQFGKTNGDLDALRSLIHALRGLNEVTPAELEAIATLPRHSGQQLGLVTRALREVLVNQREHLADLLPLFQGSDVAHLEQSIFRRQLEEHSARFPEKPLDEVRRAFLTKLSHDGELPPEPLLNRALEIYRTVQELGNGYRTLSRAELKVHLASLRDEIRAGRPAEAALPQYLALNRELVREHFGVYPYNTQLITIALLILGRSAPEFQPADGKGLRGMYAQIRTGEGKSLILAMAAGFYGLNGRRVDVVTSNSYLARRDVLKFQQYYADLSLKVAFHEHASSSEGASKDAEIIYSTNHDMIFTLLRARLQDAPFFNENRFDLVMVDESDNLVLDLGRESVRIATQCPTHFPESVLEQFIAFVDGPGKGMIPARLPEAEEAFRRFCPEVARASGAELRVYLAGAAHSREMTEGRNYIVENQKVIIVDVENTGRKRKNSSWQHGVQEFVTLRRGLPLQGSSGITAQLNHPDFLRKYRELICISGTMGDVTDRREFQKIYRLRGFDVPPHHPSKRLDLPITVTRTRGELERLVENRISDTVLGKSERPVLIIADSVSEASRWHERLRHARQGCQLLNDVSNLDNFERPSDEEPIVERAGNPGMLTASTHVAGRGADFKPKGGAVAAGGFKVVITNFPLTLRVENQARGRAGRQGEAGSSEILVAIEEDQFLKEAPLNLSHIVSTYGGDSLETRSVLEFLRRGRTVIESLDRYQNALREQSVQALQEYYFTQKQELRRAVEAADPRMRMIPGAEYVPDPLAMVLEQGWTTIFRQFDIELKDYEIRHRHRLSSITIAADAVPANDPFLQDAFHRSFGHPSTAVGDGEFWALKGALLRLYRRQLVVKEHEVRAIQPTQIRSVLAEFQGRVRELIAKARIQFIDGRR